MPAGAGLTLDHAALDRLMPMHALVSPTGHIRRTGPTLAKLRPGEGLQGARFLEVFELRRPRNIARIAELAALGPTALSLRLRDRPEMPLKGLSVALDTGEGLFVNLSFGIAAVEAVGAFDLNGSDFPPTDLTTGMLYLVEAKEAVMRESRNLNMRLQGAKIAAEEAAFTDTLTGLKNRRAMDMILARYAACRESFSLMHIDLDFFKQVNDTHGHAAGDHVLQVAARILKDETRDDDTACRFGGDEFVLIFHRMTDRGRLAKVAARILARLERPIPFEGHDCRISGSIGIAVSDDYAAPKPEQMLIDADMALYASKKAGRARASFVGEPGGGRPAVAAG